MATLKEIIQKRKAQKTAQQSPTLSPLQIPKAVLLRLAQTLSEAEQARDHLLALITDLQAADITGPKGPKGEKGDKGDSIVGPRGPRGEPGLSITGPRGPRGEPGKNPDLHDVLALIKEEKLSIDDIRGLAQALQRIGKSTKIGGGGMSLLAGSNISLTRQTGGRYTIAATNSAPTIYSETPTGAVDGANKTYTTAHTITTVYGLWVNGQFIHPADYVASGAGFTMNTALPVELSGMPFTILYA